MTKEVLEYEETYRLSASGGIVWIHVNWKEKRMKVELEYYCEMWNADHASAEGEVVDGVVSGELERLR